MFSAAGQRAFSPVMLMHAPRVGMPLATPHGRTASVMWTSDTVAQVNQGLHRTTLSSGDLTSPSGTHSAASASATAPPPAPVSAQPGPPAPTVQTGFSAAAPRKRRSSVVALRAPPKVVQPTQIVPTPGATAARPPLHHSQSHSQLLATTGQVGSLASAAVSASSAAGGAPPPRASLTARASLGLGGPRRPVQAQRKNMLPIDTVRNTRPAANTFKAMQALQLSPNQPIHPAKARPASRRMGRTDNPPARPQDRHAPARALNRCQRRIHRAGLMETLSGMTQVPELQVPPRAHSRRKIIRPLAMELRPRPLLGPCRDPLSGRSSVEEEPAR